MLVWFSYFSCDFINNLVLSYIFMKLNGIQRKANFIDTFLIFLISILTSIIIVTCPQTFKLISKFLIMIGLYKFMYHKKLPTTTISVFLLFVSLVVSEFIFSTIMIVLLGFDQLFFQDNFFGILIANLLIISICYVFHRIKIISNLEKNIIDWYEEKNLFNAIFICVLAEITMYALSYQNYTPIESKSSYIIWNIFLIGAIVFIVGYFKQRSDNGKLLHDYDNLLKYSKEYEKELIMRSKNQHEYRNQLIVIDSMITGRNKDAKDYIKDLLNEPNYNEDFQVIEKLSFIQLDGLKGFIHFKIQEMLGHKINVFVDVSKQLEKKKLWKICNENLQDISRCLGVYLDNAMEATLSSKDKAVIVEIYLDEGHIVFSISNTYQDKVDFSKIDQEGYSSKGKNRGYGLSFVKEIIENNLYLNQKREVVGTYYIQKLFVQTK